MKVGKGEVVFATRFRLTTTDGEKNFKPIKGSSAAVLILGRADGPEFDVEKAMNDLGWFRKTVLEGSE